MRFLLCATALLAGLGQAAAEQIPLPRPRPSIPTDRAVTAPTATEPETPSACRLRLTDDLAVYRPLPAISGPGECGAQDVVELRAIVLPSKRRVEVSPPAIMRCTMAEAIVQWVREDVAPLLGGLGELRQLENYDSYECRGQNRVVGAKLSEHGRANALDVRSFKLAGGTDLVLTDPSAPEQVRLELRRTACARFTTVLGPGSDGYHEGHVHLDRRERHNGYRICEWDVRTPEDASAAGSEASEIPLPRPRPALRTRGRNDTRQRL